MKPNSSSRYDATEKMLRRQEWKREQERQRQHEKLKERKIYEYEIQRAREKGLPPPKPLNCNKSRSKSPRSRPRRPCTSSSPKTPILSGRLESANGTMWLKTEGTKISAAELCRFKVDIHRNISGKSTDLDLQRDIINPEDVVVKRRMGEGSKPIFEREEINGVVTQTDEVEEHRTVVTVNNDTSEGKSKMFKKRSISWSPIRNRSHSPRRTLSRHSRDKRSYRNCLGREERVRSREHRVFPPHYIKHIPFPIYYSHFPPRPIIMTPFMPIRGQVPFGNNRYSPMMGPSRADFSPRFMHPPFNPSCYRSKKF